MRPSLLLSPLPFALVAASALAQATIVPTEIQQPGTQPGQAALESVSRCDNCHAGYDPGVEPAYNWSGSAMAHATRDPLFWATVAVAEADFSGSGDLCLRCHTPEGWMAGRSTPTDGADLHESDADGVSCDVCHQLTDPDDSEHLGVQLAPFVANDEQDPPGAYLGSGMFVLSGGTPKLGPYSDPDSPHQALQSLFHRSSELCGTCHDVSNPAVGDLAHNNGSLLPLAPGSFSGVPGSPVEGKAAFNNFPYAYGTVERTFSEHMASLLPQTRVADFASLPAELRAGALLRAWTAATEAVPGGDYADGAPRYFTCQTCHMPPVQGRGCNRAGAPLRDDLPLHDLTGGNTWIPDAIVYLADRGELPLGNTLSSVQRAALAAGKLRARQNLTSAASLSLDGNLLRVVNLTGHKLISGYPEGRRMWLHVLWRDGAGALLREDGAYGPVTTVSSGGASHPVSSLLDPDDPETRVYQAHMGLTREWAVQLLALGYPAGLPLGFDRSNGTVTSTLGDLGAEPPGTRRESFHFVLNNVVLADNRIPPYGMSHDQALVRNALPIPPSLYGDPGPGGRYRHYDELELHPPAGAASATIELLYQATSWEYVQFLYLANTGTSSFLADSGQDLLEAWLATGMSEPVVMATTTWGVPFEDCNGNGISDAQDIAAGTSQDRNGNGVPDECERKIRRAPAPPPLR